MNDFNLFMRLKSQLVTAAENFGREGNLSPVLKSTMSKDMNEQLKLAHKVIDVVNRANRKIPVTLFWYNLEKLETSCAQVRLFAKKESFKTFFL